MSVSNQWVTFDCFGTLVDWQAWFDEVLNPIAGRAATDVIRAYHAHERIVEREYPHRSHKDVLVTALVQATAEQGVRLPVHQARSMLMRAWPSMRLFDDVEAMLAELRGKGYRLAVLTNCDDDLFWTTHRLFRTPFDMVLTAERVRGLQAGAMALPRIRDVDSRRPVELGARGQQLVSRHRTRACARRATRVARS